MICPLLNSQCVKNNCALWFQEIDKNQHPVENMCGCSVYMTAQYLMEMRPYVFEIENMDIRQSTYFDKINEKLGLIADHAGNANTNLIDLLGGDRT